MICNLKTNLGITTKMKNNFLQNPSVSEIQKHFKMYQDQIYPLVAGICTQKMDGMHGLNTHTASVVFRGTDYALSLNKNPLPVIFACAFHDMARINDNFDIEHGKNAVPLAKQIMEKFNLDKRIQRSIIFAIENHTTGTNAPDYISACLWDADRTRLSWLYGYQPKYFNTLRAQHIASSNYQEYIKFQRKCFSDLPWDKIY